MTLNPSVPVRSLSSFAIASLVAAVLIPPVGALLGIAAMIRVRMRNGRGFGFALAALIVGAVLTLIGSLSVALWLGLTADMVISSG